MTLLSRERPHGEVFHQFVRPNRVWRPGPPLPFAFWNFSDEFLISLAIFHDGESTTLRATLGLAITVRLSRPGELTPLARMALPGERIVARTQRTIATRPSTSSAAAGSLRTASAITTAATMYKYKYVILCAPEILINL